MYGAAKRGVISERDRDTNKGENRGALTDREDALDDEVVELFERCLVRARERGGELLARVCLRGEESLASEGEAAEEPHQALCRNALLLALLIFDELLEGAGLGGVRVVAGAHFLRWGIV